MQKIEDMIFLETGWISVVVDQPAIASKGLIILCHGLTGDRSGPQRILTYWAKRLCEEGFIVVRFDFRGSGDSSGKFDETTVGGMREDLETVIQWCKSKFSYPRLILSGISLGGVVVLSTLLEQKDCEMVVLFSTNVSNEPSFLMDKDFLSIRNGQFFLNRRYFEERLAMNPMKMVKQAKVPIYFVYGENDKKVSQLASQLPCKKRIKISETDHLFESFPNRKEAIDQVIHELNQCVEQCI